MGTTAIALDAKNKQRKRPPDVVLSLSPAMELQDKQTQADGLNTTIWLSGNELKHRVIQFYSGSRTSKKRK